MDILSRIGRRISSLVSTHFSNYPRTYPPPPPTPDAVISYTNDLPYIYRSLLLRHWTASAFTLYSSNERGRGVWGFWMDNKNAFIGIRSPWIGNLLERNDRQPEESKRATVRGYVTLWSVSYELRLLLLEVLFFFPANFKFVLELCTRHVRITFKSKLHS